MIWSEFSWIVFKLTYHDDPCGSQGPKQTQQKSDLQDWFLHTMWLQPPSFSIVAPENWKIIC